MPVTVEITKMRRYLLNPFGPSLFRGLNSGLLTRTKPLVRRTLRVG